MQKDKFGHGGGGGGGESTSVKRFLFSIYRVFNPYFSIGIFSDEKTAFVDKSRVEPTFFFS